MKKDQGFLRGHLFSPRRRPGLEGEEAADSAAGAGVGDVSMAAGGKKLDDVASTPLLDAPHGSSGAADAPSKVPANVAEFTVDVGGVVAANNVLLDANAELTRKLAALEQDSKNLVEIMRQSPLLRQRAEACHADMAVAAKNELSLDNLELLRKVAALEENKKKLIRAVHQFQEQQEQAAAHDLAMTEAGKKLDDVAASSQMHQPASRGNTKHILEATYYIDICELQDQQLSDTYVSCNNTLTTY